MPNSGSSALASQRPLSNEDFPSWFFPSSETLLEELSSLRARVVELERDNVQLRQGQEVNAKSRRGIKSLLDAAGPAVAQFQEKLLYVNRSFEKLTGYPSEILLDMHFAEIIHPDHREDLVDRWKDGGSVGADSHHCECQILRKDGSVRWADLWIQVARVGGNRVGLLTAFDITERRQAERALREREKNYRTVVQNLDEIVYWVRTIKGRPDLRKVKLVSGRVKRILGYKSRDFVNDSALWSRIIHPEDRARFDEDTQKMFATGKPCTRTYRMQRKGSQSYRYIEDRATPELDDLGRVVGILGVSRDVTRRRRREAEAIRLASFPQESPNLIVEADAKGVIRYANPAANAFLNELDLGSPNAIVPGNHRELVDQCLSSGQSLTPPKVFIGERVLSWSYYPVAAARVVHVYGVDVTEIVAADQDRRSLEAQVQHAQKLESLGLLAGGIAHDFNNLLTGILGYASLARQKLKEESPAHKDLHEIERIAQKSADLTRQMLAYSGKGQSLLQPIDINTVIEEMTHLVRSSVSKRATLDYRQGEGLPAIKADPTQVQQVVMNLIINASDAIGSENGTIDVRTGVMDVDRAYLSDTILDSHVEAGCFVYFEVSDTGCGMDEETLTKIFDPFYTTKFTGRGLGLAAVLGILRSHGGTIRIDSQLGQGTTIRALFPAMTKSGRPDTVRPSDDLERPFDANRECGTVLVIDDEAYVRALSQEILGRCGYTVITAADGYDGAALFADRIDDVSAVILDLTMPRMNGAETYRAIKALCPAMPIIITSAYAEPDAMEILAEYEPVGFLRKPFHAAQLADMVRQVLAATDR